MHEGEGGEAVTVQPSQSGFVPVSFICSRLAAILNGGGFCLAANALYAHVAKAAEGVEQSSSDPAP